MGQYFKPVFLSEDVNTINGWLHPHDFNSMLKLTEHGWLKNPTVIAIENLLAEGEPFYKTKLVWGGDYADGDVINGVEQLNHYDRCNDENKIDSKSLKPKKIFYRYLINHTKQQFVDKKMVPKDKDGWRLHPLPILTCEGNGRGGGDYGSEYGYGSVGMWARDVISVSNIKPEYYTEIRPNFKMN